MQAIYGVCAKFVELDNGGDENKSCVEVLFSNHS